MLERRMFHAYMKLGYVALKYLLQSVLLDMFIHDRRKTCNVKFKITQIRINAETIVKKGIRGKKQNYMTCRGWKQR